MSRIRTIKPEFFRHSGLQSLEEAHQRQYPMLVFAGLLTLCDKNGTFLWQPPHIKLDVLPFIPFDMQATLETLVSSGMVIKFTADGREYGHISTFQKHQRVSGTEAKNPARYPHPMEAERKQRGSTEDEWNGNGNVVMERMMGSASHFVDSASNPPGAVIPCGEPLSIQDQIELIELNWKSVTEKNPSLSGKALKLKPEGRMILESLLRGNPGFMDTLSDAFDFVEGEDFTEGWAPELLTVIKKASQFASKFQRVLQSQTVHKEVNGSIPDWMVKLSRQGDL